MQRNNDFFRVASHLPRVLTSSWMLVEKIRDGNKVLNPEEEEEG